MCVCVSVREVGAYQFASMQVSPNTLFQRILLTPLFDKKGGVKRKTIKQSGSISLSGVLLGGRQGEKDTG